MAVDNSGNIYIADQGGERVRKVTESTGIISTVAGDGGWATLVMADQLLALSYIFPTE